MSEGPCLIGSHYKEKNPSRSDLSSLNIRFHNHFELWAILSKQLTQIQMENGDMVAGYSF